ncbi:MAG: coproporphyrinogen III oxidase [Raoultibacter sp.]
MEQRHIVVKFSVPFCIEKCTYCPRTIIEGWNTLRMHAYLEAVQQELIANAKQFADCRIAAVHWGGGLASMANGQDVSDTMRLLRQHYMVADDAPVTMRAAIANISGASMPFFKRAGVTRFDFEMMSLSPIGYTALNNRDSLGDLPVICDHFLRAYANDLLGIVLAAGSKQAGADNFRRSVVEFTRLSASHLVIQRCVGPDAFSDTEIDHMIDDAKPLLEDAGFVEYAPLKFAPLGKEDVYAQLLRGGAERLSFGLGGCSCIDGVKTTTTFDLPTYLAGASDFAKITVSAEPL